MLSVTQRRALLFSLLAGAVTGEGAGGMELQQCGKCFLELSSPEILSTFFPLVFRNSM